jgi:hypothetical protein
MYWNLYGDEMEQNEEMGIDDEWADILFDEHFEHGEDMLDVQELPLEVPVEQLVEFIKTTFRPIYHTHDDVFMYIARRREREREEREEREREEREREELELEEEDEEDDNGELARADFIEMELDEFIHILHGFPEDTPEDEIVEAIMDTEPIYHTLDEVVRYVHTRRELMKPHPPLVFTYRYGELPEDAIIEAGDHCPLCLDDYKPGMDITYFRCKHVICNECWLEYLKTKQRNRCPTCKNPITDIVNVSRSFPAENRVEVVNDMNDEEPIIDPFGDLDELQIRLRNIANGPDFIDQIGDIGDIGHEDEEDPMEDIYPEWDEDIFELDINEFPDETPDDIIVETIMTRRNPRYHTREAVAIFVHNYREQEQERERENARLRNMRMR